MVMAIPISIMVISGVFFDYKQDTDANINGTHYSPVVINGDTFQVSNVLLFSSWTIKDRRVKYCDPATMKKKTLWVTMTAFSFSPPLPVSLKFKAILLQEYFNFKNTKKEIDCMKIV